MDLCLICLRSDRRLVRVTSDALAKFHDELCEFSVSTMTCCTYCNECHHLLKKFHKFKEKCIKALQVYQNWLIQKPSEKQPINTLSYLLPPSTLGAWIPHPKRIANYSITYKLFRNFVTVQTDTETYTIDKSNSKQVNNVTNNFHDYIKNVVPDNKKKIVLDNKKNVVPENKKNVVSDNKKKIDLDNKKNVVKNKPKTHSENLINFDETPIKNEDIKYEATGLNEIEHVNLEMPDDLTECDDTEYQNIEILDEEMNFDEVPYENVEMLDEHIDYDMNEIILKKEKVKIEFDDTLNKTDEKVNSNFPVLAKNERPSRIDEAKAREMNKELEAMFDIDYLTTKQKKIDEFHRRKTYKCYLEAEHKCDICYTPFKNAKTLEYHLKKWHTESPNKRQCDICKVWSVKRARGTRHAAHRMIFKCKLCSLVTRDRRTAVTHSEWHSGKKYHCVTCDITYKSNSSYNNHMGRAHRKDLHLCLGCGRGFGTSFGLQIHRSQSTHCTRQDSQATEGEKGVACEYCDVTFPSMEVYGAHMFDVHRKRKRGYNLSDAGVKLDDSWRPKRKKRAITTPYNLGKYSCKICGPDGGVFVGYYSLKHHVEKQHPAENIDLWTTKKYMCDLCGRRYNSKYVLRDHMNVHTGALPYSCDICDKSFRSQVRCNEHRLRHFPGTFKCSYCDKKFKSNANKFTHERAHLNKRDYHCHLCDKSFTNTSVLKEHVKGVHNHIRRVRKKPGAEGKSTRLPRVEEILTEEIVTEEIIYDDEMNY